MQHHTIRYGVANMKKVDKKQWFIIGLQILGSGDLSKITIDNLCSILQITKGSFYHHFGNIDGYVKALMEYWLEAQTTIFIQQAEALKDPKEKLKLLADTAAYALNKSEEVIRGWGYSNDIVKKYVTKVDEIRLEYLIKLGRDRRLNQEQAKDMATIQYALLVGMQQVCSDLPPKEFKKLQDIVINKFK